MSQATVLVRDGTSSSSIVIPVEATPVSTYAARELAEHVELASGAALPVVSEREVPAEGVRVFIGACQATRDAGIDVSGLAPEEFIIRVTDRDVYLVGGDSDGSALSQTTQAGTLWAVYELLETELGVRWLWPGDLGRVVPQASTIEISAVERRVTPWLIQRRLRGSFSGRGVRGDVSRGFTDDGLAAYAKAETVFLRRHRMGRTRPLRYGHAFESWWTRYGEEHPDWFQLLENGERGPASPRSRFSMCVSNPDLHRFIVDRYLEQRREHPEEVANINGCENDIRGLCTCERCLAWDGPQPENVPARFGPRVVSDRYARFWLALQRLAARQDPDALVIGYAYVNYALPPTPGLTLNEHVFVGTVPDLFFPRSAERHELIKEQWLGWARTGCRLFLRPNYFLDGYCMPHIFVHQFADEFEHSAANGMIFTDFDSLTGQWAAQGPNLYVLARLHARPGMKSTDILDEYYAGFGAAADHVRAYFEFWESHVNGSELLHTREGIGGWSRFADRVHLLYPEEAFARADEHLERAAAAAAGDRGAAERVDWLRLGAEHARLCARASSLLSGGAEYYSPVAASRAVRDVVEFRQAHERDLVANFHFCSYIEGRSWPRIDGYAGEPLRPLVPVPEALPEPVVMPLRGRHTFAVRLGGGERLRARLRCRPVGAYQHALKWAVYAPDGDRVDHGDVPRGETADIDCLADRDGIYVLSTDSERNAAEVVLLNDHAVLCARRPRFIDGQARLFAFVPKGVEEFSVTLESPAPGETASLTVFDPEGNEVGTAQTGEQNSVEIRVAVEQRHAGKAFRLQSAPAPQGAFEDYAIELDPALPPYLGQAADRLLVPLR